MKTFILTVVALAFAGVMSSGSSLEAKPSKGPPPPAKQVNHFKSHPSINIVFRGHDYRGWSHYCWFPAHDCYGYCDAGEWFYWCEAQGRYLPISYLSTYPPTRVVVPVSGTDSAESTTVPTSPVTATQPTLPPGAVPVTTPAPIPPTDYSFPTDKR